MEKIVFMVNMICYIVTGFVMYFMAGVFAAFGCGIKLPGWEYCVNVAAHIVAFGFGY